MRNFQDKRRWRNVFESTPFLALLTIFVLFFAWGVFGFAGKMVETVKNKQIAEAKVAELKKDKDKYSSSIDKLKTKDGVEASIRENLGLAKEGEGEIVVVDDKNATATDATSQNAGFWNTLKNWFKF